MFVLVSRYSSSISSSRSEVVLADLGCSEMLDPNGNGRVRKRLRPIDDSLHICTAPYRSPDVGLGNNGFGDDLDNWSLGCVVPELHLKEALFRGSGENPNSKSVIDDIIGVLGPPPPGSVAASWLPSLPFFWKFYPGGMDGIEEAARAAQQASSEARKPCLTDCPQHVKDFAMKALQWLPKDRMGTAAAREHPLLKQAALKVAVAAPGRLGAGTIAEGFLDTEVLEYLQECAGWNSLAQSAVYSNFQAGCCVGKREKAKGLKAEYVGIVDDVRPPICRSLNLDDNLELIESERFSAFVRALRKKWEPWFQELTKRVRKAIKGLPNDILSSGNAEPFVNEDFADNAFTYVSIQLMKPGERDDGWHTDGGTSLLHASVTLFGTRELQVKIADKRGQEHMVTLAQRPGSFYVGNMCALQHNVHHTTESSECFNIASEAASAKSPSIQIACMLRSDFFRHSQARMLDRTPGPKELYRVVNHEVAAYLADNRSLHLPNLSAVIAESSRSL